MGGFEYAKMPVCQAYLGFVLEDEIEGEDKREPWLGQRFLELQKLLRNCEVLGRLGIDVRR